MTLTRPHPAAIETVLNYVVAGEVRSGSAALASALGFARGACCHAALLSDDEYTRRDEFEAYFGDGDPDAPAYFHATDRQANLNAYRFLQSSVFDRPRRGEQAVGVRLTYPALARYDLFDLLEERTREGDFCLVMVTRNPVACLVSLKQAAHSGIWAEGPNAPRRPLCPMPVRLDAQELTRFCRQYDATRGKVRRAAEAAPDAFLEVDYKSLVFDYRRQVERVMEFLELPQQPAPQPGLRRLKNDAFERRVTNLDEVLAAVPSDVRAHLAAEPF